MSIYDTLQNGFQDSVDLVKENPLATALIAGGTVAAVGTTVAIASSMSKKRTKKSKKRKSSKRSKHRSKRKAYKYPRTSGKRKDRSRKRIRMTKSGQPYVILASGKARFISKKSARLSRKRKGGRY